MALSEVQKHQRNASDAVELVGQLSNIIDRLQQLRIERSKFLTVFADSDFDPALGAPAGLAHLTAANLGTFYDFVVGDGTQSNDITKWLADAGNGGRNLQLINQIKNKAP